jgi:hypothetical protein
MFLIFENSFAFFETPFTNDLPLRVPDGYRLPPTPQGPALMQINMTALCG